MSDFYDDECFIRSSITPRRWIEAYYKQLYAEISPNGYPPRYDFTKCLRRYKSLGLNATIITLEDLKKEPLLVDFCRYITNYNYTDFIAIDFNSDADEAEFILRISSRK